MVPSSRRCSVVSAPMSLKAAVTDSAMHAAQPPTLEVGAVGSPDAQGQIGYPRALRQRALCRSAIAHLLGAKHIAALLQRLCVQRADIVSIGNIDQAVRQLDLHSGSVSQQRTEL